MFQAKFLEPGDHERLAICHHDGSITLINLHRDADELRIVVAPADGHDFTVRHNTQELKPT